MGLHKFSFSVHDPYLSVNVTRSSSCAFLFYSFTYFHLPYCMVSVDIGRRTGDPPVGLLLSAATSPQGVGLILVVYGNWCLLLVLLYFISGKLNNRDTPSFPCSVFYLIKIDLCLNYFFLLLIRVRLTYFQIGRL